MIPTDAVRIASRLSEVKAVGDTDPDMETVTARLAITGPTMESMLLGRIPRLAPLPSRANEASVPGAVSSVGAFFQVLAQEGGCEALNKQMADGDRTACLDDELVTPRP